MTENSVYELNLLYVLESIIITVVRIQGYVTLYAHRTISLYFSDRVRVLGTVGS